MKLRYALLAVGVPLLALGGEGLYNAARSRRQSTMTCDQFVRDQPAGHWVRLTGCELDYDSPGYREANGHIAEIFVPIRTPGQPKTAPAPLLAATTDPDALAIVQATIGNGRQADQEAVTVMMLRLVTHLRASREIEGVARGGVVERLKTTRALQSFPVPLDPNYLVIDLHARPAFVMPGVEAGVGLVSLLLFILTGRKPRAQTAPDVVEAPAGPTPLPPMLLLNLEPSAGADAIEHAPPLGPRESTIATLRRGLNGLTFDDSGMGTVERRGYTIAIDIGLDDPVWTATIRASGAGAPAAVNTLAASAGWRLYVPKRGTFMDAGEGAEAR